jgi:hypothetical protein
MIGPLFTNMRSLAQRYQAGKRCGAMVAKQRTDDQLAEFLDQLATFHESQRQFVERVRRYRQWLEDYRTSLQGYMARKQMQRERGIIPTNIPITIPPLQRAEQSAPSDVTDAQWERVAPLLSLPQTRGRPYIDARRTLNGIRYVLATGCGWNHMPERYGNYVTCWRRLIRWQSKGIWASACRLLDHNTDLVVAQVIEQAKKKLTLEDSSPLQDQPLGKRPSVSQPVGGSAAPSGT